MSNQQPYPTVTFVMPIQDREDFLIEQINTVFKFSKQYQGFCELIIVADGSSGAVDATLKIAWLAIKLNKISHPHVRIRFIRYTSELSLNDLIETSVNHAFGQKIMVATKDAEKVEKAKINDMMNREVLITQYLLNPTTIQENLNGNSKADIKFT